MTRTIPRPSLIERRMSKFLREPPSVRTAASVISTATFVAVVAGGLLIRLVDPREYHNVWVGMWWALQTITTVGYGDVTPRHMSGRLVAALVMLEGIAFLAIITAAITSTFVARTQRERDLTEETELARIQSQLEELTKAVDTIKQLLRSGGGVDGVPVNANSSISGAVSEALGVEAAGIEPASADAPE